MKECNACQVRHCNTVFFFRKEPWKYPEGYMGRSCPKAVMPKLWTRKFLYTAIVNSPQATMEVLARAKLRLQEIDRYPGFRLLVEGEEEHGQKKRKRS